VADVVVDLNDQRPVWSRPDWFGAELRAALPTQWTMAVMDTPAEGTGDGSTGAHPSVLAAVEDARVYMGFGISEDVLLAGPNLGWVHTGSAGVGSSLSPEMLRRDLVFTNSAGIHGPPMAEAVLGMILHFFRGFDLAQPGKAAGRWDTRPFYRADAPLRELAGSTVGIVGLGGIGAEVAWRCAALGARVVGLKRTPGGKFPPGVEAVYGPEGFHRVLESSDAVVVTTPDTPETRGMIDAAAFARMKQGAVFVNVARGRIVEEAALIRALQLGHLRGAGLDVFQQEPLPSDSPLWSMENVLITPHVSPVTDRFWRRAADLILHNLAALLAGRPQDMRNRVDKRAGY
jgi:phosphoglycerate dehydrogenase-like enzyme